MDAAVTAEYAVRFPVIDPHAATVAEILAYALQHNEAYGVWGGTSENERRRLRRGEEAA